VDVTAAGAEKRPHFPGGSARRRQPSPRCIMPTEPEDQYLEQLMMHQLHAHELRIRAAQLCEQAEEARKQAFRAIATTTERRRLAEERSRERAEFEGERKGGTQALAAYILGLRHEQEVLRAEDALQQDWFREQVLGMLEQGWNRRELAEVGFSDQFLAELGLTNHPALQPG
jgi:hypothetical protein